MSLYDLPPGDEAPVVVNLVVEIPKGSRNKIEYDPKLKAFRLDRILHSPLHYPGDYGFIPGTLSPDGDALDVLALVTDPTFAGCIMSVRPIGVLVMRDEAGKDEKILAVPTHDPRFAEFHDIADLPAHLLKEAEYFFNVYKELEGKPTVVIGWEGAANAYAIIRQAIALRQETHER
jgi:inorganic pyrophosphatase